MIDVAPVVSTVLAVSVVLLGVAVIIGLVRVATAPDDASRAVVGDLVYFSAIGVLVVLGMVVDSAVVDDAVMIAALLGILATVSLSRIITRGRR